MILRSAPQTDLGTLEIKQITTYGCLNTKCDKFGVEIARSENVLESFTE